MAANLQIRELSEGLSFRVKESPRRWRIFLSIAISAVVIYFFVIHSASTPKPFKLLLGGFCAVAIVKELLEELRGTNVELRVTNLDLISTGRAPRGYSASSIPRAAIYNLEFREATGGAEDAPQPSGLYVEHHGILVNPTTCVLPYINEGQTRQVIEAILNRFPDTELLAPVSPREPYLTTLNLNKS